MLLGPGCLNYSLVLPLAFNPKWRDVRYSLRWVLTRTQRALGIAGLQIEGDCDLALQGRKISGNAQRRTQQAILHHGTLLYNFDVTRPEDFLKAPYRQPRYRAERSHRDFLGNLPLNAGEIRQRMVMAWC